MSKPTVTDPIMMAICLEVSGAFEVDDTALGVAVDKTLDMVDEAMAIPS